VEQAQTLVAQMETASDDGDRPWVKRNGWGDPHESLPTLEEIHNKLGGWKQLHDVLGEALEDGQPELQER
jgi:hypothetical protein